MGEREIDAGAEEEDEEEVELDREVSDELEEAPDALRASLFSCLPSAIRRSRSAHQDWDSFVLPPLPPPPPAPITGEGRVVPPDAEAEAGVCAGSFGSGCLLGTTVGAARGGSLPRLAGGVSVACLAAFCALGGVLKIDKDVAEEVGARSGVVGLVVVVLLLALALLMPLLFPAMSLRSRFVVAKEPSSLIAG